MADTSHYAVLEVARDAAVELIRTAYRKLALKWHPDKVADPSDEVEVKVATQQFQRIAAAWEVLGDADQRRRYDFTLEVGPPSEDADAETPPWKRARRPARAASSWAHSEKKTLHVPDDAPTVAAAVDMLPVSGGTIKVRPGVYPGLVVVAKPFVTIVAAEGVRPARPPGDPAAVVLEGQVVFRQCAMGARLEGLTVRARCKAGAVDLKGVVGNVVIEGCDISNAVAAGVILEGCSGATALRNCTISGCKYDGLGMHVAKGKSNHSGSVEIADSIVEGNGYDGLYLGDTRYQVAVLRSQIVRNKRHGILVRGSNLELHESSVVADNGGEAVHHEAVRVAGAPPTLRPRGAGKGTAAAGSGAPGVNSAVRAAFVAAGLSATPRELEVAGLPAGWKAFRTPEGHTYYQDTASGLTQWSPPAAPAPGLAPRLVDLT